MCAENQVQHTDYYKFKIASAALSFRILKFKVRLTRHFFGYCDTFLVIVTLPPVCILQFLIFIVLFVLFVLLIFLVVIGRSGEIKKNTRKKCYGKNTGSATRLLWKVSTEATNFGEFSFFLFFPLFFSLFSPLALSIFASFSLELRSKNKKAWGKNKLTRLSEVVFVSFPVFSSVKQTIYMETRRGKANTHKETHKMSTHGQNT